MSRQVSWIRKRDLHILTAGVLTYTSDERFQVIHPFTANGATQQKRYTDRCVKAEARTFTKNYFNKNFFVQSIHLHKEARRKYFTRSEKKDRVDGEQRKESAASRNIWFFLCKISREKNIFFPENQFQSLETILSKNTHADLQFFSVRLLSHT